MDFKFSGGQVLKQLSTTVAGVAFLAGMAIAQTPPAPAADPAALAQAQADFATLDTLTKETDLNKRLAALDEWTQKSPNTNYKTQRNYLYVDTYSRQSGLATQGTPTEQQLKDAETADHTVLDKADALFSPEMKPQGATDAVWAQAKAAVLGQANQSLAAIYAARKDYASLEKQDLKLIELNPNDAKATLQLANAIYLASKERHPEAFYQFARATSITGTGALDPALKKSTEDYLTRAYKGYHGSTEGLDQIKAMAAKSPMPPADFKIESVTDISKRDIAADQEFVTSHPEIMSWRAVKAALVAPDGDAYFSKIKGAAFPKTKAKVVSQPGPRELTVSIDNATPETASKAEATLKFLDATINGTVAPGTEVTFTEGEPASLTKEPFMLVFSVEKTNVEGVDLTPAAAGKKMPVRKRKTK